MQVSQLLFLVLTSATLGSCASLREDVTSQVCGETISLDLSGEVPQVTCSSTCAGDMQTWSAGSVYKRPPALSPFGLMVEMQYTNSGVLCSLVESVSDEDLLASFRDESGICDSYPATLQTSSTSGTEESYATGSSVSATEFTSQSGSSVSYGEITSATGSTSNGITTASGEYVSEFETTYGTGSSVSATEFTSPSGSSVSYGEITSATGSTSNGITTASGEYISGFETTYGTGSSVSATEFTSPSGSSVSYGEITSATGSTSNGITTESTTIIGTKTTTSEASTIEDDNSLKTSTLSVTSETATPEEGTPTTTTSSQDHSDDSESGKDKATNVSSAVTEPATSPEGDTTTTSVRETEAPEETTNQGCVNNGEANNSEQKVPVVDNEPTTTTTTAAPTTTSTTAASTTTSTTAAPTTTSTTTTRTTTTSTTTTTTTPAPVFVCPNGWSRFADSCYRISTVKGSWESGEKYCKNIGGSYVTISSSAEQNYLKSLLRDNTWIGYNDRAREGTFVWSSGETSSYRAFASGEPNNGFLSSEDCVEMRKKEGYLWNDEGCSNDNYYACETGLVVKS